MPSITVSLSPKGAIVNVIIGASHPRLTAYKAAGQTPPATVTGQFLIDTGASCTCVDPALIKSLGLPQIGKVAISTPSTNGGQHFCEQFDASLFIPGNPGSGGMMIPALPILTTHLQSQGIDGLIGLDVINRCTLIYSGTPGFVQINY